MIFRMRMGQPASALAPPHSGRLYAPVLRLPLASDHSETFANPEQFFAVLPGGVDDSRRNSNIQGLRLGWNSSSFARAGGARSLAPAVPALSTKASAVLSASGVVIVS